MQMKMKMDSGDSGESVVVEEEGLISELSRLRLELARERGKREKKECDLN